MLLSGPLHGRHRVILQFPKAGIMVTPIMVNNQMNFGNVVKVKWSNKQNVNQNPGEGEATNKMLIKTQVKVKQQTRC